MTNTDFTPLDDGADDLQFLNPIRRRPESAPAAARPAAARGGEPPAAPAPAESAPPLSAEIGLLELAAGAIVEGTILSVSRDEVVLDINYKMEGIVPREELPLHLNLKVGQRLKAMVVGGETDEGIRLSYRQALWQTGWKELEERVAADAPVACRVVAALKQSGYRVDVGGVMGFLPASQLGQRGVTDPETVVGQEFECKVIKLDRERHDVVVSRRQLVEDSRAAATRDLFGRLRPGEVVRGVVKSIRKEYAFVDLGGFEAFLHISNLAWRRVAEMTEVIAEGEELEAKVLEVDAARNRITIGLKQLRENPWARAAEKYPVGTAVTGRVAGVAKFGAFVELEEGVTGLVPLRELSWNPRLKHAEEEVAVGQAVTARVLAVEPAAEKLALSIKATRPDPWGQYQTAYKSGDIIEGKVLTVTERVAFVSILEGIEGIIRQEDLSWTDDRLAPATLLAPGETRTFKILRFDDEDRLVRLGLKQITEDPWVRLAARYPVGKTVEGKVVRVTGFGAFVELEPGLDGLVHISQLADKPVARPTDVVKPGEVIRAKVSKVDLTTRRINLSVRDQLKDQERNDMEQFIAGHKSGGVSLGELLGVNLRDLVKKE